MRFERIRRLGLKCADADDDRCSYRHAMLVDQRTEGVVVPLNLALDCSGKLELANSSLSEMAVLGVRILVYVTWFKKPDRTSV